VQTLTLILTLTPTFHNEINSSLIHSLLRGASTFSKLGVQFLGLGYCKNKIQMIYPVSCTAVCYITIITHPTKKLQKRWGGPSKLWGVWSRRQPPSGCTLESTYPPNFTKIHTSLFELCRSPTQKQTNRAALKTPPRSTSGRCKTHKNSINGHYTRTTRRNQYQTQINPFSLPVHTESVLA